MKVGELIKELENFDYEMLIEVWEDAVNFPMAAAEFVIESVESGNCRCQIVINESRINYPVEDI